MGKNKDLEMSVIIPVFNVEEYLPACIESVMRQGDLLFEIILIDDGSTDNSGMMVDQYTKNDYRIRAVHQENRGISAARNAGLTLAQGEYIAFIDSDDWIKDNSLLELYRDTKKVNADMAMGKIWYYHQDGSLQNPDFNPVPEELISVPLTGKECFIRLVKAEAYLTTCNYIYRRSFLDKIQARYETGIMHEDELWNPVVLCQAEKAVIFDFDYYYYRMRKESVMYATKIQRRLSSLFHVTNRLIDFSDNFDFSGADEELKNWLYVNIFRLYFRVFTLLTRIKDSSFVIPEHHLDRYWRDCCRMLPEPQQICHRYFIIAESCLRQYINWRISPWVASIGHQISSGKKLLLVYNIMNEQSFLRISENTSNWLVTTD